MKRKKINAPGRKPRYAGCPCGFTKSFMVFNFFTSIYKELIMSPPRSHPGGRPSRYPQIDLLKLEEIARNGYTVAQMADYFKIGKSTFNHYRRFPEFRDVLNRSRAFADQEVERALYRRAIGYSHPCDVVVYGEQARVVTLMKHEPPSVGAARLWLSNRQPDRWAVKAPDLMPPCAETKPDVDLSRLTGKDQDIILEAQRLLQEYDDRKELIFVPADDSGKKKRRKKHRHHAKPGRCGIAQETAA